MGRTASVLLYLGVVGGASGLGALALAIRIPAPLVAAVLLALLCAFFYWLERRFPWSQRWLESRGDVPVDLGLFASAGIVGAIGVAPIAGAIGVAIGGAASARFGSALWPSHWPVLAQGALALLVADFFRYWVHRAEHQSALLWRLHVTHHASERLYFFNGIRLHPLEILLSGTLELAPLIALGASVEALALRTVMVLSIGRFQHCNIALDLGPLNRIFSTPQLHRWHHARNLGVARCNYGGDLCVWDLVFRTWFLPADREASDDVGIPDGEHFPRSFGGVLRSPFSWRGAPDARSAPRVSAG